MERCGIRAGRSGSRQSEATAAGPRSTPHCRHLVRRFQGPQIYKLSGLMSFNTVISPFLGSSPLLNNGILLTDRFLPTGRWCSIPPTRNGSTMAPSGCIRATMAPGPGTRSRTTWRLPTGHYRHRRLTRRSDSSCRGDHTGSSRSPMGSAKAPARLGPTARWIARAHDLTGDLRPGGGRDVVCHPLRLFRFRPG